MFAYTCDNPFMATLTARDVADDTIAGIDLASAEAGFKAREAYLRWFANRTWGPTPKGRNASLGLTQRFAWVVETLSRLRSEYHVQTEFSVPFIARALGHTDPSTVDAYMRLERPISFDDGDRLCALYGVDRKWLETGEGSPFYKRAKHRDVGDMFRELYQKGCFYELLVFVLGDEPRGECMVFGVNNSHEYTLLASDIPVHDDVGNTGHASVVEFATLTGAIVFLKNATRYFFGRASGSNSIHQGFIRSSGIILPPDKYRDVEYGRVHPAELLSGRTYHFQSWHEDLPDLEYGVSPYTQSYVRARNLYVKDLAYRKITTNEQLVNHIATRLQAWQPSGHDLTRMLREKDDEAKPWEHYSALVEAAHAGDEEARRTIEEQLFWGTRIAMPDWLD